MTIQERYLDFPNRRFSTQSLRAIRNNGYEAITSFESSKSYSIIESLTIHVFENVILVQARYCLGNMHPEYIVGAMPWKVISAYTKDLKTYKEYKDQFEPKEGYHHAYEYAPHDAPFPTKSGK